MQSLLATEPTNLPVVWTLIEWINVTASTGEIKIWWVKSLSFFNSDEIVIDKVLCTVGLCKHLDPDRSSG